MNRVEQEYQPAQAGAGTREWMEMLGRLSGRLPAVLLAVLLLAGGMNVSKGESQMEIPITDIRPVRIGQAENTEAGTGCTVLICENGMAAGLDVRGGGPASRESQLLNPLMAAQTVHAVVLSGGSAYGLGTANGVMQKASILRRSAFFTVQLSHPYMTTGKTIALTRWTFVGQVVSLLF